MSAPAENSTAPEIAAIESKPAAAANKKKRAPAAELAGSTNQKKVKTTVSPTKEVDAFKAKLAKSVFTEIKKTGHSDRNLPWSTVQLGIPSKEFALAVLGDVGGKVTSSGANSERREVNGHYRISTWLGLTEYCGMVHPVKLGGRTIGPVGGSRGMYAWAAIDEMVSTIKANQWTLKFKTRMCATGKNTIDKLDKAVDESDEKLDSENEQEA